MKSLYRGSGADSYGYVRSLAGRVSYSLVMPKAYGCDVDLNSYLGISGKGLAGYVNSHFSDAMQNFGAQAFYPVQKQVDFYKQINKRTDYDSRFRKDDLLPYDLPSMRRPVLRLERMMS